MTTILNALGHSNSTCSVSTDAQCQYPIYLSRSPNNSEINAAVKHDDFPTDIIDDASTTRFSPTSLKTTVKDGSSPGSLELPSMPSEKSSSRACSDGRSSSGFFIPSDLTDTERSNSTNSLSPVINQVDGRSHDRPNYLPIRRSDDPNMVCQFERQNFHDQYIREHGKSSGSIDQTYVPFLPNVTSQTVCPKQSQFAFNSPNSYPSSLNASAQSEYPPTWKRPNPHGPYSSQFYETNYLTNHFTSPSNQLNIHPHVSPSYPYPSVVPDYHKRFSEGSSRNHSLLSSNQRNYTWHQYEHSFYKHGNMPPAAYSTPRSPSVHRTVQPRIPYCEAPTNQLVFSPISSNYVSDFPMRSACSDSAYVTANTDFNETSGALKNVNNNLFAGHERVAVPYNSLQTLTPSVSHRKSEPSFANQFNTSPGNGFRPKLYDSNHELSPNLKRQVSQKRSVSHPKIPRNPKPSVDVIEKVEVFTTKYKRKASKTATHLVDKRRRTSEVEASQDASTYSTKGASLESIVRSILPQNVSRFVQDPVISPALHLHPPSPSPCTFPLGNKLSYSGDKQPCSIHESFSDCGRKYYHFPFCLRKPIKEPATDASIFRFVTNSSDLKCRYSKLVEENFLIDSYKRAISKNVCLNYFPPATPTDPSSPLTNYISHLELCDSQSDRLTPPLISAHKNDKFPSKTISPTTSGSSHITAFNATKTIYAEETIYFNQLPGHGLVTCSHCVMQILTPEKALSCKLLDKETRIFFCSLSCAAEYKKNHPNHNSSSTLIPNEANNCFPPMTLALTDTTQSLPIFLQKNVLPKVPKTCSKRPAFSDNKSSRRRIGCESHGQYGLHLIHSSPFKRWHDIRWRRFSESSIAHRSLFHSDYIVREKRFRPFGRSLKLSSRNRLNNDIAISGVVKNLAKSGCSDGRACCLCHKTGDQKPEIAGRLINIDFDKWTHVNCIIWCYDTYETVSGSLVDVPLSLDKSSEAICTHCGQTGAGLPCFDPDCSSIYHLPCAHKIHCLFYPDRSMFCPSHHANGFGLIPLQCLNVDRRVYVCRDENSQVANVILNEDCSNDAVSTKHIFAKLRIGALVLNQIGQLLPEQLTSGLFHTSEHIYPVGYWSTRIYWSYRHLGKRCRYHCRIEDGSGCSNTDESSSRTRHAIRFVIDVSEDDEIDESFEDATCDGVWQKVLTRINQLRHDSRSNRLVIFQDHIRGETLYGLSEPHIVRAIESLPGVDRLNNYAFKFGKLQLIKEMPLAINPTGCARSEPKLRTYVRRKPAGEGCICQSGPSNHISFGSTNSVVLNSSDLGSPTYATQSTTIMSKSQQYRRLRSEWKTNVILARSRIQGLGLYAARDLSKHTFIIEYLGEVIRNEVGNRRERLYESQNRGVYMFRVDDDWIVDATMCGGLARYINHSCDPNCTAEILNCDNGSHIIIIANKNIEKGDELTYDYKFDVEEDRWDRIPCLCGSVNCRKWMN